MFDEGNSSKMCSWSRFWRRQAVYIVYIELWSNKSNISNETKSTVEQVGKTYDRTYRAKQNWQLNKWARLTIEHIEQNKIDSWTSGQDLRSNISSKTKLTVEQVGKLDRNIEQRNKIDSRTSEQESCDWAMNELSNKETKLTVEQVGKREQ